MKAWAGDHSAQALGLSGPVLLRSDLNTDSHGVGPRVPGLVAVELNVHHLTAALLRIVDAPAAGQRTVSGDETVVMAGGRRVGQRFTAWRNTPAGTVLLIDRSEIGECRTRGLVLQPYLDGMLLREAVED